MNWQDTRFISNIRPKHLIILSLLLTGCQSIGPTRVKVDSPQYRKMVGHVRQVELLTDIVRLRYIEPLHKLRLSSITSSYSLDSTIALSVGWNWFKTKGVGKSTALAGIEYQDVPTISYSPVEGKTFTNALLKPLEPSSINTLILGSSDNLRLIYRLTFAEIGCFDNASFSTGAGNYPIPRTYIKNALAYLDLVDTLSILQKDGVISIKPIALNDHAGFLIHIKSQINVRQLNKIKHIKKALHIPTSQNNIVFLTYGLSTPIVKKHGVLSAESTDVKNVVLFQLRSAWGIMQFLSNAVDIPESDIKSGVVRPQRYIDGQIVDWSPFMKGVMKIYTSEREPRNSFVKTFYQKHWFYIDKSDTASKTTFSLLTLLLQTSEISRKGLSHDIPQLILPAGALNGLKSQRNLVNIGN